METHLRIIGYLLIVLSGLHAIIPRYFQWRGNLQSLSLFNRQLIKVHTFFIALVVLGIGFLSAFQTSELINTSLGKNICLGLGIFWSIRALIQFFGYSSTLWKGKAFETTIHILASAFWIYMSLIFLLTGL